MKNKELFGPLPLRGGGGDEAGVFGRLGGGGVCLKQHERSEYLVSGDRDYILSRRRTFFLPKSFISALRRLPVRAAVLASFNEVIRFKSER